ncbi:MAG: YqgE/AlgH family protein [Opitutales bacterium]
MDRLNSDPDSSGGNPGDGNNLSGSFLVASPQLQDPNFAKTVILVSAHSEDDGTLGVVLNRPMGKTLGEFNDAFAFGPLKDIPLYVGGPVSQDRMILAAWKWNPDKGIFKLFFGIDETKAETLLREHEDLELRGFLGYSGWEKGQVEMELEQHAWIVSPVDAVALDNQDGEKLWKTVVGKTRPSFPGEELLPDQPDDPSLN